MIQHALIPNWPAPNRIKAYTTLRTGGVSQASYTALNLADHVGDQPENVRLNRELLTVQLNLPDDPIWIEQTHSNIVIPALPQNRQREADASFSSMQNQVCVVLTADCLPLLVCDRQGNCVAAIHAGWRGLANGIIAATLDKLPVPRDDLLVWLGPAISAANYEVGHEVREQFLALDSKTACAFTPSPEQRWLANLYTLARLQLEMLGVSAIYGGDFCTYADSSRFYSYRRDGSQTGRMASLIWISAS